MGLFTKKKRERDVVLRGGPNDGKRMTIPADMKGIDVLTKLPDGRLETGSYEQLFEMGSPNDKDPSVFVWTTSTE